MERKVHMWELGEFNFISGPGVFIPGVNRAEAFPKVRVL